MKLSDVITDGSNKPPRIIIYGPEGVGKTTFCTQFENPIFILTEDGLTDSGIAHFPLARSFRDVVGMLDSIIQEENKFKTVVIESLDWLEPLIWAETCTRIGAVSIEAPGYGRGYVEADTEWREFFNRVDAIRDMGKVVVMTAHSAIVHVYDPQHPEYDMHTLKLHKRANAIAKEFSDVIGFCSLKTLTTSENERNRAITTGDRIMNLGLSPAFTAKNRYGMPDTLELNTEKFLENLKWQ